MLHTPFGEMCGRVSIQTDEDDFEFGRKLSVERALAATCDFEHGRTGVFVVEADDTHGGELPEAQSLRNALGFGHGNDGHRGLHAHGVFLLGW